jgi:hypothetical protein
MSGALKPVGWTLVAFAAALTLSATLIGGPGYGVPIPSFLGLAIVGFMFMVNANSADPKIVAERKSLVLVLALLCVIDGIELASRLAGIDPHSPWAAVPYLPVIAVAVLCAIRIIRQRRNNR